jgi:hypothetical protein
MHSLLTSRIKTIPRIIPARFVIFPKPIQSSNLTKQLERGDKYLSHLLIRPRRISSHINRTICPIIKRHNNYIRMYSSHTSLENRNRIEDIIGSFMICNGIYMICVVGFCESITLNELLWHEIIICTGCLFPNVYFGILGTLLFICFLSKIKLSDNNEKDKK